MVARFARRLRRALLGAWLLVTGCGLSTTNAVPTPSLQGEFPKVLSAWGLFHRERDALLPRAGVQPYDLNTPLFSDYAHKFRTLWVPSEQPIQVVPDDVLQLPVGSVLSKTFYYPLVDGVPAASPLTVSEFASEGLNLVNVRLIETRVLVHRADGWHAAAYVWDDQQREATLAVAGKLLQLPLKDDDVTRSIAYLVPDRNQCAGCHERVHGSKQIQPLGIVAANLHRNYLHGIQASGAAQLQQDRALGFRAEGILPVDALVAWDDESAPLDARAKAYLTVNCAHCHNARGAADTSGLLLDFNADVSRTAMGVCKSPVAAGRGSGNLHVGIHPGQPDASILVYRMASEDPAVMMPELGRAVVHREGLALIRAWISAMRGNCTRDS